MKNEYDIGLIGLAVMGQNLVLNMADHGFGVAVYNRTASTTDVTSPPTVPSMVFPPLMCGISLWRPNEMPNR